MPTSPRRPRDTNELAKSIVSIATGEMANDSRPASDSPTTTAHRRRGAKGGKARTGSNCTPHEELMTTVSDSATPFATYYKSGEHRNGVKVWHEYEYYWNAYKVTEPLSITEK